jgi:hypothetical protein
MRRLSLTLVAAAAVLIATPAGAGAQTLPDASCPGPSSASYGVPGRLAQTFTAINTGSLDRAEVEITNLSGPEPHTFQINAAGTTPTESVLATATISDAAIDAVTPEGTNGRVNVVFPAPAPVAAGQSYALVLSREPGGHPSARTVPDANCPGRLFESFGGPWAPVEIPAPRDLVFTTFVTQPAFCKGRQATVIGTAEADDLVGTDGPDVIAALGGDDEVSGLKGKDLICGGTGKDKLRGGKGKDRLLGQGGKDKLRGGSAKDICKGGKQDDTAKGCEVEKSI